MEGLENNKIHMIFYTNHKIDIPEKKNGKQNHSVKKKIKKKKKKKKKAKEARNNFEELSSLFLKVVKSLDQF